MADSYWIDGYFENQDGPRLLRRPRPSALMATRSRSVGRIHTVRVAQTSRSPPKHPGACPTVVSVYTCTAGAARAGAHQDNTGGPSGIPARFGMTATVTIRVPRPGKRMDAPQRFSHSVHHRSTSFTSAPSPNCDRGSGREARRYPSPPKPAHLSQSRTIKPRARPRP